MALPVSEHFLSVAGFQLKSKPKSYAQAAASTSSSLRMSLLYDDLVSTTPTDESAMHTQISCVYRSPRYRDAFLFDISKCAPTYTERQCMKLVKQQHPHAHACIPLNDGPKKYLEAYITPVNDTNDILHKGIISDDLKLVTLKLSRIRLYTDDIVHEGLRKSLSVFGRLLDFGVYKDKDTDFFMDNGYAVLDTFQADDIAVDLKYTTFSHQLSCCEFTEEFFLATWNNMPTWCRYCHKDGRTKFECELSEARILCYACYHYGHRSFKCPRRNHSQLIKKKDRKSYQTK
ncbi:MAG: hypothetical protein EXX96DRAFT_447785, partial [Benjaminiella poitrasii]